MTIRGSVDAVCVVHEDLLIPGPPRGTQHSSAIDKRAVGGRVMVRALGLETDHVCDPVRHGGVDQAVYAYAEHEARRWSQELGKELPAGWFGENLRVSGVEVSDAVVGEQWAVGDSGLLLEVTVPRTPCFKFAHTSGEPRWLRRFAERGDVGAYLRVLAEGAVGAGDEIRVVHRPEHGVSVRQLFDGSAGKESMERLLASPRLSAKVERDAKARLARLA